MKDKVTIHHLKKLKQAGKKICMVTAYDATFARLFDEAGVDAMLVGDSVGMVVQGQESTLPVTMDDMVYHCRAVSRGVQRAHVVGDLPFMSYQASPDEAVRNAGRLISEGHVSAVKLEGGLPFCEAVRRIVDAGIPVMGHLGLTPQSVHAMGGYRVQAREETAARKLMDDALALQEAGIYALVLEGIPLELAKQVTARLEVPTIGIGAGKHCDGQVLVSYDLLGLNTEFKPKFVKRYADLAGDVVKAVEEYCTEVRDQHFPDEDHSFRSTAIRLVSNQSDTTNEEVGERSGPVYGVPI